MDCFIPHCAGEARWREDQQQWLCGKHYRARKAEAIHWKYYFNQ